MSFAHALRGALLAAIAAPLGCGGNTTSNPSSTATDGAGGGTGGTAASGGSNAGGAPGGGGATTRFPCKNPTPKLSPTGADTGYDTCDDGLLRRRAAVDCASTLPRATACSNPPPGGPAGTPTCSTDADCTAHPYGFCQSGSSCSAACFQTACACSYGCTKDADCGGGAICECGDPVGTCAPNQCRTSADCSEGDCLAWVDGPMGCGTSGFACQLAIDECAVDADCPPVDGGSPRCLYEMGHRTCVSNPVVGCAAGRPLASGGRPIVARLVRSRAWT